jgi:hypothetical protein
LEKPSNQELIDHFAYHKSDTDFWAYARLIQSKWREKNKYPKGKSEKGTTYGNYIEIEYAKRNGSNFLTNKTWETAKKELEKANKNLFGGIEAKYVEKLEEESNKKAEEHYKRHIYRYKELTENYGLFKPEIIDEIRKPPYSQIWRDHLLSISLKHGEGKKKDKGYFVYLYPYNNSECRSGIKDYMKYLQNPESSILEVYVEDLIKILYKRINEEWVKELLERYIMGL